MNRSLPSKPNLEHLKKQAKDLLTAFEAGDSEAVASVDIYFPGGKLSLTQAQLVLAREYGFPSWRALTRYVDGSAGSLEEFLEAAFGGQLEKAKKLWSANRDAFRLRPAAAAAAGDVEALRWALEEDPSLATRQDVAPKGRPLFIYVCQSRLYLDPAFEPNLLPAAELMLGAGADPDASYQEVFGSDTFKSTVLYGAVGVLNHAGLTKLLLDAGADPNEGNPDPIEYGGEVVYHACDFPGRNVCLQLVLEKGVSQAARDYCILRKLDFEDQEGVKLFIKAGSNLANGKGRSALCHAILRDRSLDMLALLLDNGADPNEREKDGTTPYVMCRRMGKKKEAEFLVSRGAIPYANPYDSILIAAADGELDLVRGLATQHPEVVSQIANGTVGWHLNKAGLAYFELARLGRVLGVQALLDLGLPVDLKNPWNQTALHQAALNGKLEMCKYLVSRGASIDVVDSSFNATPPGWAQWAAINGPNPEGQYRELSEFFGSLKK